MMSTQIVFDIEGLDRLESYFGRLNDNVTKKVDDVMEADTLQMKFEMIRRSEVFSVTGEFMNSFFKQKLDVMDYEIGNFSDHAPFVEIGFTEWHTGRWVEGHHVMENTIDEMFPSMFDKMSQAVQDALEESG